MPQTGVNSSNLDRSGYNSYYEVFVLRGHDRRRQAGADEATRQGLGRGRWPGLRARLLPRLSRRLQRHLRGTLPLVRARPRYAAQARGTGRLASFKHAVWAMTVG